jgi:CheY-like chemotaxis protein
VRDTGIGIASDKIERIFQPFEQATIAAGGYTSGTGLGLPIARKILELFGTTIHVASELGKGSEFSFDVWLRETESGEAATVESVSGRFAGHKALVVDDVRLNRVILVNLLRDAGFEVDEAQDGVEGLNVFTQSEINEYDIVFMDIQMPVMNGWDSAAAIRKLPRPDAVTVLIVAISANAFREDVERSLACGMNAHYAKPIRMETLSEIVMKFCKIAR